MVIALLAYSISCDECILAINIAYMLPTGSCYPGLYKRKDMMLKLI